MGNTRRATKKEKLYTFNITIRTGIFNRKKYKNLKISKTLFDIFKKQNGDCSGIWCAECPFHGHTCYSSYIIKVIKKIEKLNNKEKIFKEYTMKQEEMEV